MSLGHAGLCYRTIATILCVCLTIGCDLSLARSSSQANEVALSIEDRSAIVKDVLTRQLQMQDGAFRQTWNISTQNVEFLRDTLISKARFHLITPDEIQRLAKRDVVEYQVFKKFTFGDGLAMITVMNIVEGETCFSGHMKSQATVTYVYRQQSGKWMFETTRRPAPAPALFDGKVKAFW